MDDQGIRSSSIALFRTTDGHWRVMDFEADYFDDGSPTPETFFWGPSLRDAMRTFGRLTARKPTKPLTARIECNAQLTLQKVDWAAIDKLMEEAQQTGTISTP